MTTSEKPDLAGERSDYIGGRLIEADAPDEPWSLFDAWLAEAFAARDDGYLSEPTAMSLATAAIDADGHARPSVRTVLLKGSGDGAISWFTNYESRKGVELAANPYAAVSLLWAPLHRQVRMTGKVERVDPEESREYFASRPRGAQIAARSSAQSRVVAADALAERVAAETERWEGRDVAWPEHWGGYRMAPEAVEFWQGRPDRLHDRLIYRRVGGAWSRARLAP
ncbi:pyridoxamine 5'-phosphate oxidase [Naumannella cuiyingiana]|uniref:Pyridoxine/pyridoxamine 5'-phosphate oxidase n=1 Tax=Naumannella cuiyingiana TaxID=1347891 RepID=A0A7Z0ILI1_9ACTN|nr:pyridoxamine 5'-phosphate oxidase [Naumannella cuiyingiana]NYI71674.1 pyridoxamine 5'-phosphate oxidase [Naumannella cuiyingiana]